MLTRIGNKEYDLSSIEMTALDEIVKGRRKFGIDRDKVLKWSLFEHCHHEVFDKIWNLTCKLKDV